MEGRVFSSFGHSISGIYVSSLGDFFFQEYKNNNNMHPWPGTEEKVDRNTNIIPAAVSCWAANGE